MKIQLEFVRFEYGDDGEKCGILVCPKYESSAEKKFCTSFFDNGTQKLIDENMILCDDEKGVVIFSHKDMGEVVIDLGGKKYDEVKKYFLAVKGGHGSSTWGGQINLFI